MILKNHLSCTVCCQTQNANCFSTDTKRDCAIFWSTLFAQACLSDREGKYSKKKFFLVKKCVLSRAMFFLIHRVAGNSAYIIGTLAESDIGCMRILSLAKGGSTESKKILPDLTKMLTFDDSESVMNAAGTMGTLVSKLEKKKYYFAL